MKRRCPYCKIDPKYRLMDPKTVRFGSFYRRSDSRRIQRFRCLICSKHFSAATFQDCYRQNKRGKNELLRRMLCSGVSQRRCSKILSLSRTTVVRKFLFLFKQSERLFLSPIEKPVCHNIEFDDMETFEHTKCKPLSITLSVESGTRRILGLQVSKMPAKGHLTEVSRKKYGPRKDERTRGRKKLFEQIRNIVSESATIRSDENPHYPKSVKEFFPDCVHETFKGRRGCIVGQGELKKIKFDPLFSLNHTCAMFRANVNRLFRKTWCTTKRPDYLYAHLILYAQFHNENLKTVSR